MSSFDQVMADTVGVVYRAATGKPDPWTVAVLQQEETAGIIKAGGNPDLAAQYARQDVPAAISTSPTSGLSALDLYGAAVGNFGGIPGKTLIEVAVVILVAILLIQVL